jgi:ribose-phosphate pyrophosphokinase
MLYLNEKLVNFTKFSNGESILNLKELSIKPFNNIYWIYENDEEFFHLFLLKNAVEKTTTQSNCALIIHYFPHSRMDRENNEYAFSLKTAAQLINNMNFYKVIINEPHSDVTPALINNSSVINWCLAALKETIEKSKCDSLFFPDGSAAKRYANKSNLPYGIGNKLRNFKTGEITNYSVIGEIGENVLIVDDLCSKGGTFINASKHLKKHGAKEVNLLVAHLENTVFSGNIFEHINKIYTSSENILRTKSDKIIFIL